MSAKNQKANPPQVSLFSGDASKDGKLHINRDFLKFLLENEDTLPTMNVSVTVEFLETDAQGNFKYAMTPDGKIGVIKRRVDKCISALDVSFICQ